MERESRYGAFLLLMLVFAGVFFLAHFAMRSNAGTRPVIVFAARPASLSQGLAAPSPDRKSIADKIVKSVNRVSTRPSHEDRSTQETAFPGFPVDINSAGVDELMKVPGIGPKTARRIVEKRAETGGFRSINELTGVQRIGRVRLDSIRRYITVNAVRPAEG
ncbi:MAG: helix-hairpin-helix domain-containing protein [Deltaproteobacteria bacterium]|nr:helix-hairpin-helix domain-containing protein [Deltaproteobacteria bacterium]